MKRLRIISNIPISGSPPTHNNKTRNLKSTPPPPPPRSHLRNTATDARDGDDPSGLSCPCGRENTSKNNPTHNYSWQKALQEQADLTVSESQRASVQHAAPPCVLGLEESFRERDRRSVITDGAQCSCATNRCHAEGTKTFRIR